MVQLRWSRVTTGWRRQDLQAHVTKNPVGDKAAHDGGVEMLRKNCCCLSAIVLTLVLTPASHGTWSIVIADADTREVAVGTVTCLNQFDLLALVPVLVVGKGGAAVQSFGDFDGIRRPIIFDHLMMGTPPEEIFAILENIEGHEGRQYGITDTKGRKITFSGSSNGAWAGGVIGSQCSMHYAIQGNVLTGQCVVDAIEQAVRNTEGDIAEKLMAGMEAARAMGGDGRCSCDSFETESCGCPAQKFAKAGHIGGMAVARIGDADDPLCDAGGCVDGDYFMRLNVAFQGNEDPDPVQQLRQQFNLWRAGLAGRPDAVQSAVALEPPSIPPDGGSTTTMTITLLDRGGLPVDGPILSVTVEHAADSAGHSAIGGVTDNKDGTFSVTLTAGTKLGIDRFAITVDDGIRPVVLMPEPALEYCVRPDCILDCNDNGIVDSCDIGSGTSGDCNGNFFPDECDIASGGSLDCDGNIVPDECEPDCNGNGVADACDIAGDFSTDEDENGIPDDCHGIFRVPEEFSGIQAAIDQALSGDTVLISSGTYSGADNRDLDLAGRDVLVKCRTGPADCIIDCQNSGRGFIFQTAETRSAVIEGLTITNGTANLGGAIYCTNQSSPTIRNCWLLENTATVWGGGIYSDGGSLAVSGCKIQDNVAQGSRGGGGMFLFNQAAGIIPSIENTLFSGNSGRSGGGIYVVSSAPIVRQCTFTGNHAEDSGGGIFVIGAGDPSLIGCIFWGDTATEGQEITLGASLAAMTVQFSNVAGGAAGVAGVGTLLWGTGNIGEDPILHDPLFADPTGADGDPAATKDNDYHLLTSSPCIDTGDPNFVPPNGETDLAGGTRLVDGDGDGLPIVDMGCYEHQECPADLDGSGSVGVPDLIELLAAWGPNPDHPADFDGNGLVRVPDLIILLGRWGPCI